MGIQGIYIYYNWPGVMNKRKVKAKRGNLWFSIYNKCQVSRVFFLSSLCLSGIYLLGISIPSLFWTLSSTPEEVVKSAIESRGSLEAVLGGTFLLFSYGISIYHLMYMSAQRFCAVKWPFLYRAQSDRAVFCHIVMLWVFGILCSTVPGIIN